jgi:hypothetical protein
MKSTNWTAYISTSITRSSKMLDHLLNQFSNPSTTNDYTCNLVHIQTKQTNNVVPLRKEKISKYHMVMLLFAFCYEVA